MVCGRHSCRGRSPLSPLCSWTDVRLQWLTVLQLRGLLNMRKAAVTAAERKPQAVPIVFRRPAHLIGTGALEADYLTEVRPCTLQVDARSALLVVPLRAEPESCRSTPL